MNIKELIFDVTVTTTYQITVSTEEGYDMPTNPKDLVHMINDINCSPRNCLGIDDADPIDTEIEVNNYEIKEV